MRVNQGGVPSDPMATVPSSKDPFDPEGFDADPAPTFYKDADPDPTFCTDTDLDTVQTFTYTNTNLNPTNSGLFHVFNF